MVKGRDLKARLRSRTVEPPLFLFLFGGGGGGEADDVRRRLSLMVMDSDVYLGSEATNTMKMI